jgi:hypothetical protein
VSGKAWSSGQAGENALSRVSAFVESYEEEDPFWDPLKGRLRALLRRSHGQQRAGDASLNNYRRLFDDGWPSERVDEDWLSNRFNMALMYGSNYLLLRHQIAANDPLALLHIRCLADERISTGWSDKREEQPKMWATALGALTLHR